MTQLVADAIGLTLIVAALTVLALAFTPIAAAVALLASTGVAVILLGARYATPPEAVSRETQVQR